MKVLNILIILFILTACDPIDDSSTQAEEVQGIRATDGTYTDKVVISWDSLAGANNYLIHKGPSAGYYPTIVGMTDQTTFEDLNVESATVYFYAVQAEDSTLGWSRINNYDEGNSQ